MSNENETPPAGEAPKTPPTPATPAAPAPGAQTTLPGTDESVPPVAAAPGVTKVKKRFIRLPEKAFKKRIRNEASVITRAELGMDLEEAKRLLAEAKSGKSTPAATPAGASAAETELRKQVTSLERQVAKLAAAKEESDNRINRIRTRERDRRVAVQLQAIAVSLGVSEEHVDFALDRYQKAVSATPTDKTPPEPRKFFQELRQTRAYLFDGHASPPVPVKPSTAPPESRQPGEATPEPTRGAPKPDSVETMDGPQFGDRTFSKYGYRPGA